MPDGYFMETLSCDFLKWYKPHELLNQMIYTLQRDVWCNGIDQHDWMEAMEEWFKGQPFNASWMMTDLYHGQTSLGCYVHGDPTFSNVMVTLEGEKLRFIDPIRPVGKVAWLPEVDIGKMLQSVVGWEHVMFGWAMPGDACLNVLRDKFSEELLHKAVFWLMIHALRIIPYASGRSEIALEWASHVAKEIFYNLGRNGACSTLMTLMERSQILGRQYWKPIEE